MMFWNIPQLTVTESLSKGDTLISIWVCVLSPSTREGGKKGNPHPKHHVAQLL